MQIQKPKQGYKMVKLLFGKNYEIPQHWKITNLEDIVKKEKFAIVDGPFGTQLHSDEYVENGIPLVNVNNIDKKGNFVPDNLVYISNEKFEELKRSKVLPNDLVLAKTGATIGKITLFPTTLEKGLVSSRCAKISMNPNVANFTYVYYYLFSKLGYSQIISKATATTMPGINLSDIKTLKIILSDDISEQQKIASILSNVDSLIQQTQKIIERTQNLKKGLMQKLFTKGIKHAKFVKSEIGLIPKEWELVPLEDACLTSKNSFSMGPFGSDIKTDNFVPVGVPVIRGVNLTKEPFNEDGFVFVTEEKADELRAANAFPNDLIFTHRGTLGQVGIIPSHAKFKRYVISQSQMKCVCNDEMLNPMFAFYYFLSEIGQKIMLKHSTKSGVPHIVQPLTSLRRLLIPVPNLEEQNKIVEILCDVSMLIDKRLAYKSHLENIKKGLMQKLLTGQIRVKV